MKHIFVPLTFPAVLISVKHTINVYYTYFTTAVSTMSRINHYRTIVQDVQSKCMTIPVPKALYNLNIIIEKLTMHVQCPGWVSSTNIVDITCMTVKTAGSFSFISLIPLASCVTCVFNFGLQIVPHWRLIFKGWISSTWRLCHMQSIDSHYSLGKSSQTITLYLFRSIPEKNVNVYMNVWIYTNVK